MRVTVFGATGESGRATLRLLLASKEGHTVVALARRPEALDGLTAELGPDAAARLKVLRGDLFDADSVRAAVEGADAVVFVAGVASIKQAATQRTTVYSVGGRHMLDAMRAAGVKRLIAVTSQGCVHDPSAPWLYSYLIKPLLMRDMYADMRRLEAAIAGSAPGTLSATVLRPTKLESAPLPGRALHVGEGLLPRGACFCVDRADLAAQIVAALEDERGTAGKTLYVSC
ncbi:hypothetical protein HT031_001702 [Scenedesmus sp. PABB004]|nr:hypothetical protein HT031_001702 [Scenedesmus sp. PABB004]